MVRMFLACSLVAPHGALHTTSYTTDETTETIKKSVEGPDAAERIRSQRQADVAWIADRILSEVTISSKMGNPKDLTYRDNTPQGFTAISDHGVFRTRPQAPFSSHMFVHWHRFSNLVIIIVRDPNENSTTVETTLSNIGDAFMKYLRRAVETPSELIMHPEKVATILHVLLPNGLLVVQSQAMTAQVSLEISEVIGD